MKIINTVHPDDFKTYQTSLIKGRFLKDELAQPGKINFAYTQYDRMMVGLAIPLWICLGNGRREFGIHRYRCCSIK